MLTIESLLAQPDNKAVLRYLGFERPEDVRSFKAGTDGSPFDEGGQIFFHRYAAKVPAASRCSLSVDSILAHERTARIFALHMGRFTIALRRDFSRWECDDGPHLRRGETFDGTIDLRPLGRGWVLFHGDDAYDINQDEFYWAYELAGGDPHTSPST